MVKVFSTSEWNTDWIDDYKFEKDITKADLVVLPGGADIHPDFYGEHQVGKYTYADKNYDGYHFEIAKTAYDLGIPIVGICRGAQLMSAFSGGKLIQHVTNHHSSHNVITNDGQIFRVNSIHHQMMFPFEMKSSDFEIIARSETNLSTTYLNGRDEEINVGFYSRFCEPEIIHFKNTKSLGIQSHPEMGSMPTDTLRFINKLVKERLLSNV